MFYLTFFLCIALPFVLPADAQTSDNLTIEIIAISEFVENDTCKNRAKVFREDELLYILDISYIYTEFNSFYELYISFKTGDEKFHFSYNQNSGIIRMQKKDTEDYRTMVELNKDAENFTQAQKICVAAFIDKTNESQ